MRTPQEIFEAYSELPESKRREFKRMVKGLEDFKRNVDALVQLSEKYGPEKVTAALKSVKVQRAPKPSNRPEDRP